METLDQETFQKLIESRNLTALHERLMSMESLDVAILLESASEEQMAVAFRLLPKALAVEVFDDFDGPTQHRLLESMANRTAGQLLEAMSPDDRTELLEEVPASVTRRLLGLLSPEQRQVTLQLLGYEENSAGREMTPYFVDLRSNMTVAQAMERIRTLSMDRETIYECYVIDPRRRLEGTVSLKQLVLARPEMTVADVTEPNPRRVFTHSGTAKNGWSALSLRMTWPTSWRRRSPKTSTASAPFRARSAATSRPASSTWCGAASRGCSFCWW